MLYHNHLVHSFFYFRSVFILNYILPKKHTSFLHQSVKYSIIDVQAHFDESAPYITMPNLRLRLTRFFFIICNLFVSCYSNVL